MVRIELTTYGLRNRCSTTELHWPPVASSECDFAKGFPKSAASGTPIAKPSCPRFVKTNIPGMTIIRDEKVFACWSFSERGITKTK
jgi:hypothetical protein